jgi:hypothetical protein
MNSAAQTDSIKIVEMMRRSRQLEVSWLAAQPSEVERRCLDELIKARARVSLPDIILENMHASIDILNEDGGRE